MHKHRTAHMYATDALVRWYAHQILDADFFSKVRSDLRVFFTLPLAHSENQNDQNESVRLNIQLGNEYRKYAEGHREIISPFPHHNALLLRESTVAEYQFMNNDGFVR